MAEQTAARGASTMRAITKEEAVEFVTKHWLVEPVSQVDLDQVEAIATALYETNGRNDPGIIVQVAEPGESASDHPAPRE